MESNNHTEYKDNLDQINDPVLRLKKLYELSMTLAGDPVSVFRHVARIIGEVFDVRVVCLSEIRGDELYFVSVYVDGEVMIDAGHCPLNITPCATVESTKDVRIYDKVIERFPEAGFLKTHEAFSYCGFPALDSHGEVIAVTCLLDDKPHDFSDEDQDLLRIFGQRISVEIERLRQINVQREFEVALQEKELHYRRLVESANAIPWEIDLKTMRFSYVGPQAEEILGFPLVDWYEENFWLNHVHPDDREWAFDFCQAATSRGEDHQFEYRMIAADGRLVWIRDDVTLVSKKHGLEPTSLQGYMFDITSRKLAEAQIQQLAYYDSLTQLPNRSLFMDRLQQALNRSVRHQYFGAVLYLDLDRFKTINDSLGHSVGDILLQQLAVRLSECVRTEDTVARLGGDEFVVLFSDMADDRDKVVNEARMIAEKILLKLSAPYLVDEHELQVSPSIGIALYPEETNSVDDVLKHADTAMYRAKVAGREAIQFFQPSMQAAALERLVMEKGLRYAIEQNELLLHFQPLVEMASNKVIGAEVLLRWQHPQRGMVMPDNFIPIAEETGQILALGEWVLRHAAIQFKAWQDSGLDMSEKFLAVNVSPRQFRQSNFVESIVQILAETKYPAQALKLEITEGVVMADIEDSIQKMQALKAHGIAFAIDDFGTGHSSLAYIKRLPLDVLKIDKSFVLNVADDPNDMTIVETIISMAQHLGLDVVAEGVETKEDLEFLKSHGCGCYQGYYFSRPVAAEAFVEYLQ